MMLTISTGEIKGSCKWKRQNQIFVEKRWQIKAFVSSFYCENSHEMAEIDQLELKMKRSKLRIFNTTRLSPLQVDGSRSLCLYVNALNRDGVVEIVLEYRFSCEKDTQRRETCKFCHSGRNFCAIQAKLDQVWHCTYLFIYKLQA